MSEHTSTSCKPASISIVCFTHVHIFPQSENITCVLTMPYIEFIHSNLISCSLIGSLVNTWSVLKMSTALRVLCPDWARCFWCVIARVNVTSTDPFFHWVKLLIFFMFSGILRPFYLFHFIHEHEQMILFFCCVWIRLINLHLLLLVK